MKNDKKKILIQLRNCADAMVRGSISSICINCKRANCTCENKKNNLAYRLTYKDHRQKTKIVYVPVKSVEKVKKLIESYAKYREVTEQLIELNVDSLRQEVKKS